MMDIVERLRKAATDYDEVGWHADVLAAAEEIERLRMKLAEFENAPVRFRHIAGSQPVLETFATKDAEIERLKTALDALARRPS
jgi:hypothetical protein